MKRGDEVLIKRGAQRNTRARIVEVMDPGYGGGSRVVVAAAGRHFNLAATSVEPVAR